MKSMKAMVCTKYGSPDVLQLQEVEQPLPNEKQILIRVHTTAVNSGDLRLRKADPWAVRLFLGLTKPRQPIFGSVFAGTIEEVGSRIHPFSIGDKVFGMTGMALGTYGEYICMPENGCISLMPNNMDFIQAAAVPFGVTTALHFLKKAMLQKGEKILIYGASGAVGSAAVQLARYSGAEVTAVCSSGNASLVRSLGADHVIDYTKEDFNDHPERYDVVFETVNKLPFSLCRRLVREEGRLILGAAGFADMLKGAWSDKTKRIKVLSGVAQENKEDIAFIKELIENDHYTAVIDRSYPLAKMVEAHQYVELGHKKGNVVIVHDV